MPSARLCHENLAMCTATGTHGHVQAPRDVPQWYQEPLQKGRPLGFICMPELVEPELPHAVLLV